MKLKCDLIIQSFNDPVNRQVAGNHDKVHKASTIGLYRPKLDENYDDSKASSSNNTKSIILTIETKTQSLKYKLKKVETYTKFISEGRATLKLIDENIFLLISNCVSLTLINFISFLNIKIAKDQLAVGNAGKLEKKSFVSRLLNNAEFSMGKNNLNVISPLEQKEIDDVMKARAARLNAAKNTGYSGSPVRAGNTFVKPTQVSTQSKSTFKRSMSSINMDSASTNKPGTLKRSYSTLNDAHIMAKMPRSASSTNLLIELTDEQKSVVQTIKEGKSVFFTGRNLIVALCSQSRRVFDDFWLVRSCTFLYALKFT
jgi:hypothetical protein